MERRVYWLWGAVGGFVVSGVLVWVSATRFMETSALHRAGASVVEMDAMRQRGFFWVVASVVACGVGLVALVRYLILKPTQTAQGAGAARTDGAL